KVVMSFSSEGNQSIEKSQSYFNKSHVQNDLLYIKTHFSILTEAITKLESVGSPLTDSLKIIEDVHTSLKNTPGQVGKIAYEKLTNMLTKNPGYKFISEIKNCLSEQSDSIQCI